AESGNRPIAWIARSTAGTRPVRGGSPRTRPDGPRSPSARPDQVHHRCAAPAPTWFLNTFPYAHIPRESTDRSRGGKNSGAGSRRGGSNLPGRHGNRIIPRDPPDHRPDQVKVGVS